MQVVQAPSRPVQITGPRHAIEWALQHDLPDAHVHDAHGITWIEVADISKDVELEMASGGCRVHRK